MSNDLYENEQQVKLHAKLQSARECLNSIKLFHCDDMLYSFESIKQQFLSFSLSPPLLSYQSRACIIQQTICSLATCKDDSLQRFVIEISDQIRQDEFQLVFSIY